jgi:hypothetical protein
MFDDHLTIAAVVLGLLAIASFRRRITDMHTRLCVIC